MIVGGMTEAYEAQQDTDPDYGQSHGQVLIVRGSKFPNERPPELTCFSAAPAVTPPTRGESQHGAHQTVFVLSHAQLWLTLTHGYQNCNCAKLTEGTRCGMDWF